MNIDFEKPILDLEEKLAALPADGGDNAAENAKAIQKLKSEIEKLCKTVYASLTPWQIVQVARHKSRPTIRDYISGCFNDFIELHGDRCGGDDAGIIGGFARIEGQRFMLIGHQKGKTVEENVKANFGMANPEGYRKALRLMRLAEKYKLPVVSLVDTPGAYPGKNAEERGQAEAIARNLTAMARLQTPIIVIVTGEGGSGGAIGIGVGDIVAMLSNAVYSVISPEGCASILWRDGSKAPDAAAALKITAASLRELGIIDASIPAPPGGAPRYPAETMAAVKAFLLNNLRTLKGLSTRKLVDRRFEKYSNIGRKKG